VEATYNRLYIVRARSKSIPINHKGWLTFNLAKRGPADSRFAQKAKTPVRLRVSLILSLQNIMSRNNGFKIKANDVKALPINRVSPYLADNEDLALAGEVSKESTDFLTRQIQSVEDVAVEKIELREPYSNRLTAAGIGTILGLTIMLETGPCNRFPKVGNAVSHCLKVSSKWFSNDK